MRVPFQEPGGPILSAVEEIGFVENHQRGFALCADFFEHAVHRKDLFFGLRMAHVHDVDQQIRLHDLLQRGLESFDQPVRELANEADSVGEQHVLVGR